MKYSEAMLKGFSMVEGRQCKRALAKDSSGRAIEWGPAMAPHAVCVNGAANLGEIGNANRFAPCVHSGETEFISRWGVSPVHLNNEGMHWTEIYGMAVAVGL